MSNKSVLVFVLDGLGGAERVTVEIAKMLLSDGWKVRFCKISYGEVDACKSIEQLYPAGVERVKITVRSQWALLHDLYAAIKRWHPEVVFSSAMHINQRLLLLSPFFSATRFIVRNDNYLFTLPRLKRFTLRLTYRFADAVIAQTEEMEEELAVLGLDRGKIHTLHNPLNRPRILEQASAPSPYPATGATRFVAVGRLARQKGFDILVEAFRRVVGRMPRCELYIVGDIQYGGGKVYRELVEKVAQYGLMSCVHFSGVMSNPYPYVKNADVYVLSSRYEGLPNTLIEAQLLGRPCAATRCIPIISRIIRDGENGFLAETESPESLAEAMINASRFSEVAMSYRPAEREDFLRVFASLLH